MENKCDTKLFKGIFENSLRLNARSMSIKTLLSERNLRRIDYSPYYQRNYVWDNAKQSFFIESVILGTEIPPLILFKTGNKIEVIDGRQRFETLKKFKENNITLRIKGLKKLQVLKNKSFNKLSSSIQEGFLDSNIRIFEFEVINQPDLSQETLDSIKKEIFRRYNTGITPLNRDELDNARYDKDSFSELFKKELKNNYTFLKEFSTCFFPKDTVLEDDINQSLITKYVDFIRRYRILKSFPISTYASGNKTEILALLYDFAKNSTDDREEYEKFTLTLNKVLKIYKLISDKTILKNKLISECILWAITICESEDLDIGIDTNIEKLKSHYLSKINIYTQDNPHYYASILERFEDTAKFFKKITGFDFYRFIRNDKI